MGRCAVLGVALLVGCVTHPGRRGTLDIRGTVRAAPPAGPVETPKLLSAHVAANDDSSLGGRDGLSLVFSDDIDATTVESRVFIIVMSDGRRLRPDEAFLTPGSESDENRTIVLVAQFGDLKTALPQGVMVVGRLYGERGTSLQGLAADVEAFETAGRVVAAEAVAPSRDTCPDARQVVRTFWVDDLRGVEDGDLDRIKVLLANGDEVQPSGFDDHQPGSEPGQDNVLDLCLAADASPRRLKIEEGAFSDPAGHASADIDVAVAGR